jgi:hypothetical protein
MARVSTLKRRAFVSLFLSGFSPKDFGRLFKLAKLGVEQLVREHTRGQYNDLSPRRRRRPASPARS